MKTRKLPRPSIGSYYNGETSPCDEHAADLLSTFDDVLTQEFIDQAKADIENASEDDLGTIEQDILQDIEDKLNAMYDIPYASFCWQEGSFGLWPHIESLMEDVRNGDMPKTEDCADDYMGQSCDISDHGNVELYEHDGKGNTTSIWGCV